MYYFGRFKLDLVYAGMIVQYILKFLVYHERTGNNKVRTRGDIVPSTLLKDANQGKYWNEAASKYTNCSRRNPARLQQATIHTGASILLEPVDHSPCVLNSTPHAVAVNAEQDRMREESGDPMQPIPNRHSQAML
eukprot:scaffold1323_cov113-Cylindrotheca_fusiformis.AAC.10